jgi:exodeoxyribonuclease VII small subunit
VSIADGGPGAPASYEQARDELAEVVRRLEAGGVPLEESLALWERGEHLAAACQAWLDGARARLEPGPSDDGSAGGES